jgi:hypothetical protein
MIETEGSGGIWPPGGEKLAITNLAEGTEHGPEVAIG